MVSFDPGSQPHLVEKDFDCSCNVCFLLLNLPCMCLECNACIFKYSMHTKEMGSRYVKQLGSLKAFLFLLSTFPIVS